MKGVCPNSLGAAKEVKNYVNFEELIKTQRWGTKLLKKSVKFQKENC
jgi:hypothetical protein